MRIFSIISILLLSLASCNTSDKTTSTNKTDPIPVGDWRGMITLSEASAPFNFTATRDESGELTIHLMNGEERFKLNQVTQIGDSIRIGIDVYDALLIGQLNGDTLNGFFRRNQTGVRDVPFFAVHNQKHRFETTAIGTAINATGKWALNLINPDATTRNIVGVFEQEGNIVTGTLLSKTGDYRYFEGVVDGDSLKLSAFSGASPYYIRGRLNNDHQFEGEFITSTSSTRIEAVRNDTITLEDPYSLTFLKEGHDLFTFSLPDLEGNTVTLADEKYTDKVVVITIMGTWCPNCVDEAAFLAPWYKENKHRGVEVIAISFERKDDLNYARERLNKFMERFDVSYDVLFGGTASKDNVYTKLPAIHGVISYPTTLFIDKKGAVRKIHTGFYGPATGHFYDDFVTDFNAQIDLLLEENKK